MLIGYARISKADGSQSLDLQRDALREAGVSDDAIYVVLGSRFPVDFVHRLRGKGGTRIESLIPIVIFWPFALVPILPARSSADASERGPMEGAATALHFKECLRRSELRKLQ